MAPFAEAATRLLTIPGVGKRTAEVIVAEIGVDMSRFPTAGIWRRGPGCARATTSPPANAAPARPAKATRRSAPRCARRHGRPRTPETPTCRRSSGGSSAASGTKGEGKAIFAVAHTMIVIVWHVLHDNTNYDELGADYFDRRTDTDARQRHLVRQLEKLGNTVTLEPAA